MKVWKINNVANPLKEIFKNWFSWLKQFLIILNEIYKNINKTINLKSKDLIESELDFSYLTSPSILEFLTSQTDKQYVPMKYSKIFLKMDDFLNLENKIVLQNDKNEKTK